MNLDLGDYLRNVRQTNTGITRTQLSELAGCHINEVYRVEAGEKPPSRRLIAAYAAAFPDYMRQLFRYAKLLPPGVHHVSPPLTPTQTLWLAHDALADETTWRWLAAPPSN